MKCPKCIVKKYDIIEVDEIYTQVIESLNGRVLNLSMPNYQRMCNYQEYYPKRSKTLDC
ncbi:MAG: hypothetical protein ACI9CD_000338 [Candidatus Deianiraeaceae bacterium]|jgi:hypothetical protein